jgi:putative transposase
MPRSPRVVLPGYPHHVVHRGHNRRVVFQTPGDYSSYLDSLQELKPMFGIGIQAYCLMPNHVHLLIEPQSAEGMARFMKRVAGRHSARINRRENLTGGLWEGRYYSSVVARDAYWQECHRYIELNPVRAALVADPGEYRWSSCHHRKGDEAHSWLNVAPWFLTLGPTPAARWEAYRGFLQQGISEEKRRLIRNAVHRGQLTGGPEFEREVECATGRLITHRGRGRPRKK